MASHHFAQISIDEREESVSLDDGPIVKSEANLTFKSELPPMSQFEHHSSSNPADDDVSSNISPLVTAQPFIIVAIDFGTTYSGVAYAFVASGESRVDNIHLIQSWPGSNQTSDKVPTQFAYIKNENRPKKSVKSAKAQTAASETTFRWGYEVEAKDPIIRYVKLLLEPEKELPEHTRREDIEAELAKHGKTVVQAVADYLRKLREETDESLESRYGKSRFSGTPRRTVLTVPAIWSDAAKEATKKAAILAGFSEDILLVSEPEAAAIWTIKNSDSLQPKIGGTNMVVDCGGGTCDLITYECTQLSPLRLKEAAAGSGGLCGGSFVNQRFRQRVSDKMGQTSFEKFIKDNPTSWHTAEKDFEENVKRNFNEKTERTFNVPCPRIKDNAKAGIRKSHIALTTDNLREIFAPGITEIVDLITKQLESLKKEKKPAPAILLVGGYGTSKHVYEKVKKQFQPRHLEVLQPAESWAAVVKGAVLYASEARYMIESRISRYNYGVEYSPVFRPGIHPSSIRYWDELEERWRANNRFQCYIKRGESVSVTEPTSYSFRMAFGPHDMRHYDCQLLASPASTPPSSSKDTLLTTVCTLHTDLNKIPQHHWEKKTNSKGVKFSTIAFDMKMRLESGGLKIWFEIDGVEYSAMTTSFESVQSSH